MPMPALRPFGLIRRSGSVCECGAVARAYGAREAIGEGFNDEVYERVRSMFDGLHPR